MEGVLRGGGRGRGGFRGRTDSMEVAFKEHVQALSGAARWSQEALRAGLTVLMLVVLLGSVYTQQQPYKFTSSHRSIRRALLVDHSEQATTITDIWDWMGDVTGSIGGRTARHVDTSCAVPTPAMQAVAIDNVTYQLADPRPRFDSCAFEDYIPGGDNDVYLTGNHQLLLFGVFSERAPEELTIQKAIGNFPSIPVNTDEARSLAPSTDNKIVQVCEAPWSAPTDEAGGEVGYCVLSDGFSHSLRTRTPGATLDWTGRRLGGRRAFDQNQSASLFRSAVGFRPLLPCFTHGPGDTQADTRVLLFGNTSHSLVADAAAAELQGCKIIWATGGLDMRKFCIDIALAPPSSRDYYVAEVLGFPDIASYMEYTVGCSVVTGASAADLRQTWAETPWVLDAYLPSVEAQGLYGAFFDTRSQRQWLVDSRVKYSSMKHFGIIDRSTRRLWTYAVLRNLGRHDLYYSVVKHVYHLKSDGTIRVEYATSYIPIVQVSRGRLGSVIIRIHQRL
jgi:hypothetical protein